MSELRRSLGLIQATALVVGIIIGASIFVQPSEITRQMPSIGGIVAVWIAAGVLTTVLSCFPIVFLKLLDYVAIYGLVLIPVGAVVFSEHWLLPRIGVAQYGAERRGEAVNAAAAFVWAGTLAIVFLLPVHLFFKPILAFVIAVAAYLLLKKAKG